MSALLATLTGPVLLAAVSPPLAVQTGIINTLNDQTGQLTVLVKNVIGLAILIAFFYIAHRAKFAMGAIVGGLLICGLIFFALNGGLEWLGAQFNSQFAASGSAPAVAPDPVSLTV